jgi:hypothetical protein
MGKKIFLLFMALFFVPSVVMGECLDVRGATDWYVQGGHTVIIYREITPLAYLNIPYCILRASSEIQLLKTYLCDGDKILIDGDRCTIRSVRSSSFSY